MISINWTTTYNHFLQSPFLWEIIKFMRWLVGTKHVPESKTHPTIQQQLLRIEKHVPEPKTLPKIKNMSQKPKTLPRIQNTSQNPKCFPESNSVLESGKHFGFLDVILFFWEGFWILASVLGFWEVFCPYEPQWVQVLSVRSGHPGE